MTLPVEDVTEDEASESGPDEAQKEVHAKWYRKHRLMSAAVAQKTQVVRVEQLLSSSEISKFMSEVRLLQEQRKCWQTLDYRTGPRCGWRTTYLHTNGVFQACFGSLGNKLRQTLFEVDAANWCVLLDRERDNLTFRTIEYHEYTAGGNLSSVGHYDSGSLLTIDVMLADSSKDFEGGQLSLPEADGNVTTPQMNQGDAVVFLSHKYHNVTPVTKGKRTVLVLELWEGPERTCAHRCGSMEPCDYTLDVAQSQAMGRS